MIGKDDHFEHPREFIPIGEAIDRLDRDSRRLFEKSHFAKMLLPRKGHGLTNPFVERDCDRAPIYAGYNPKTEEFSLDEDEAYRLQVYQQRGIKEVNIEIRASSEPEQERIAFLIVKYPTDYRAVFRDFPERLRQASFLIRTQEILERPDIFTEAIRRSIKEHRGEIVYAGVVDGDRVCYINRVTDEASRDLKLNLGKLEMVVNEEELPPLEVFWEI